jgi:hypothetical protein
MKLGSRPYMLYVNVNVHVSTYRVTGNTWDSGLGRPLYDILKLKKNEKCIPSVNGHPVHMHIYLWKLVWTIYIYIIKCPGQQKIQWSRDRPPQQEQD